MVVFIFSLIVVSFYSLFSVGTKYIIESKNRLSAASVANEIMEIIRSMDYAQIGTTTGYINGDIPSFQEKTVDGKTFFVFSSVVYVDDPYDGTEDGSPDDDRPADYKRVIIKVAWENNIETEKSVDFVSDFAPPGVEENIGGGTLVVKVLNKNSEGIDQASVNVKNSGLGIDESFTTDSNGGVSLPGITADGNDYEITISKSGYFSIATLPPYPTSTFYPVYVHASVTEGNKNIYSITTDQISDLLLKTEDPFGNPVGSVSYNLKGGIRKGDTAEDPSTPIFYYDQNLNSGTDGENQINDISYGGYTFSLSSVGESYEFLKMFPYDSSLNDKTKFILNPGVSLEERAIFVDKNLNSVLITVLDSGSSQPVKNASVRVFNLSLPEPYDVTLTTDDFGMAYFPNSLPELVAGSYDIEISASSYQNKTDLVVVDKYTKKEINIDPN